MKTTNKISAASLACRLAAVSVAIAAMAPLPAALAPFGGVGTVQAQSNPCAPTKPVAKKAPANPCRPMNRSPANPCAPKMPQKSQATPKAGKSCKGSGNPCAPAAKCDSNAHR